MIDVNLRSVMATTSAGGGLTMLQKMCTNLDLPPPVTEKPYSRYIKYLENKIKADCERSMSEAAQTFHKNKNDDNLVKIAVSVDGTWQKRGYVSLHGVVCSIHRTRSCFGLHRQNKVCHVCKKNKNASEEWKERHAPNCPVNHDGSTGAVESEAAVEMFTRSIEKHNLFYGIHVGDGDSSSFGAVARAVKEHYGDDYDTEKEDCIDHIQKRLGTNLRAYKNKLQGVKLKDGESVGGRGRLTDVIIDKLQTCYGYTECYICYILSHGTRTVMNRSAPNTSIVLWEVDPGVNTKWTFLLTPTNMTVRNVSHSFFGGNCSLSLTDYRLIKL